jgi:carbonic anhydrase
MPAALQAAWAADAADPAAAPRPNAIPSAQALQRLRDGNARYDANTPNQRDFSSDRAARAQAQYPIAAILSCADSRVSPELAFDQGPGDLFVVRVAGNFANSDLLASLEYAVYFLGVPLVMVLGHTNCGAVDAAIKVLAGKAELPGHLPDLIEAIKPAVIEAEKTPGGSPLDKAIIENVKRQVAGLKAAPPVLQKFHQDGKIDIIGGVYELATGKIQLV